MTAIHDVEVVAHRVGEPFGTLILAIINPVIEVSLIVALILTSGARVEKFRIQRYMNMQ